MRELNKLTKKMFGHKITEKEQQLLLELRAKVKSGEITVKKAQKIWKERVLGKVLYTKY